jgi:hypothetical protein
MYMDTFTIFAIFVGVCAVASLWIGNQADRVAEEVKERLEGSGD